MLQSPHSLHLASRKLKLDMAEMEEKGNDIPKFQSIILYINMYISYPAQTMFLEGVILGLAGVQYARPPSQGVSHVLKCLLT